MPIGPSDFLVVADHLAQQSNGSPSSNREAFDRSAISRAYYAAYHHAKKWHDGLIAPGSNQGPGGGEHQTLINRLKNPSASVGPYEQKQSRMLGAKLSALRDRRVVADYKIDQVVNRIECDQQLIQARAILNNYPC